MWETLQDVTVTLLIQTSASHQPAQLLTTCAFNLQQHFCICSSKLLARASMPQQPGFPYLQ